MDIFMGRSWVLGVIIYSWKCGVHFTLSWKRTSSIFVSLKQRSWYFWIYADICDLISCASMCFFYEQNWMQDGSVVVMSLDSCLNWATNRIKLSFTRFFVVFMEGSNRCFLNWNEAVWENSFPVVPYCTCWRLWKNVCSHRALIKDFMTWVKVDG